MMLPLNYRAIVESSHGCGQTTLLDPYQLAIILAGQDPHHTTP